MFFDMVHVDDQIYDNRLIRYIKNPRNDILPTPPLNSYTSHCNTLLQL